MAPILKMGARIYPADCELYYYIGIPENVKKNFPRAGPPRQSAMYSRTR